MSPRRGHAVRAAAPFVAFASALALRARTAIADPLTLRGAEHGRSLEFVAGAPDAGLGVWLAPRFGVALEWRAPALLGAAAATRGTLLGTAGQGVGLDGVVAAGAAVPRYVRGAVLTVTASLALRVRTAEFYGALGVVVPAAVQFSALPSARVPALAELWLAARAGALWFGVELGAGAAFVPALAPSLAVQASLTVSVPIDPPSAARR